MYFLGWRSHHSPDCGFWNPAAGRLCSCSKWLISSGRDKCLVGTATSHAHVNMPAVCGDKAWHYKCLSSALSASVQPRGSAHKPPNAPVCTSQFVLKMSALLRGIIPPKKKKRQHVGCLFVHRCGSPAQLYSGTA